jgi:hypothetical protein
VLSIFKEKPSIDKMGYNYSPTGVMWSNFFWNRASFTRRLEEPVITPDRYYYEDHNSRIPRVYTTGTNKHYPLSDTIYDFRCDNCIGIYDPHPFHPEPSKLLSDIHVVYLLIQKEYKHLFLAHKNNPTIILTRYTLGIHDDFKDMHVIWNTNDKECRTVRMYTHGAEFKEIRKYLTNYNVSIDTDKVCLEFDAFLIRNEVLPVLFYYGPHENYRKNKNVTYRVTNDIWMSCFRTENMNRLFGDTAPGCLKYLSIVSKSTNHLLKQVREGDPVEKIYPMRICGV